MAAIADNDWPRWLRKAGKGLVVGGTGEPATAQLACPKHHAIMLQVAKLSARLHGPLREATTEALSMLAVPRTSWFGWHSSPHQSHKPVMSLKVPTPVSTADAILLLRPKYEHLRMEPRPGTAF